MVTLTPLACSNLANDAAIIPFPKEDVTPPVTKMYFVEAISVIWWGCTYGIQSYKNALNLFRQVSKLSKFTFIQLVLRVQESLILEISEVIWVRLSFSIILKD